MPATTPAFTPLLIALSLLGAALPVTQAQAAGPNRVLAREPMPAKGESCKPRNAARR